MHLGRLLLAALILLGGSVVGAAPASAAPMKCREFSFNTGCARDHFVYIRDYDNDYHRGKIVYSYVLAGQGRTASIEDAAGGGANSRTVEGNVTGFKICEQSLGGGGQICSDWFYPI